MILNNQVAKIDRSYSIMATASTTIRSEQRLIITVVALILGPVFMLGPAALGIGLAIGTKFQPFSLVFLVVLIAGSIFIAYHMFQNYHWVELDVDSIRGRRFWTRQHVERSIDEISEIVPLGAIAKTTETVITDQLLGSVRGYEIRFRDGGATIGLVRYDMTNVDVLIEELVARTKVEIKA